MTKAAEILDLIQHVIDDAHRTSLPNETRVLSTNAVTKRLGLTARTVRFYSEVGIASPLRRGTTRLFTPVQVRRLELARELRSIGMDVKSVVDLLDQLAATGARKDKLPALTDLFSSHSKELLKREEEVRQQYFATTELVEKLLIAGKANQPD